MLFATNRARCMRSWRLELLWGRLNECETEIPGTMHVEEGFYCLYGIGINTEECLRSGVFVVRGVDIVGVPFVYRIFHFCILLFLPTAFAVALRILRFRTYALLLCVCVWSPPHPFFRRLYHTWPCGLWCA